MDHTDNPEASGDSSAPTGAPSTAESAWPAAVTPASLELTWPWPPARTGRVSVPVASLQTARDVEARAPRRLAAPVRKLFVRREDGVPPLAGLYGSGGRSGIVALKLYLTIVWRCSTAPYETSAPARGWASLLGLEDPAGRGARRVAAALKTLAAHQLVQVTSRGGQSPVVALLDESGDGSDYTLPSTAYARAPTGRGGDEVRARSRYFLLPGRLWTEGHMQSLAGPGLVMLLILLAEQGGQGVPVWFSTESFPARYRISHKTRAAGTQQLIAQGLLLLERQSLAARPYASDLDARRYRNVYHLQGAARTRAEQTP